MTPAALPSTLLLLLLLLLLCCLSGGAGYRVEAPAHYTALQGDLTAAVFFTPAPPPTDAPLYMWEVDNITGGAADDPCREDSVGTHDHNDCPSRPQRFQNDSLDPSATTGDPATPPPTARGNLTLSLFARGSVRAIKTYRVSEDMDKLTYIFPCGLVVQGGVHFFRLERGSEVLAESGEVEVRWPRLTVDVPTRVETYSSAVRVDLSFTRSMCLPSSAITFKTWVDLLYHGVPVGGASMEATPTLPPTTSSTSRRRNTRPWSFVKESISSDFLRKERIRRRRERVQRKKLRRKNRVKERKRRRGRKGYWEWWRRQPRGAEEQPARGTVVASGARALSWAWGGGAMLLGRVPLLGLYSRAPHEVWFPCDAIGLAGLYSVRLATDVSTAPVIASSQWFTVVWSELFTLHVQAANIHPCQGSLGVHVTYPSCVGGMDKVRVYARIRANVTSVNPPTIDKYVSEQRVIKPRTSASFPCRIFQQEATDYCFVYVNTARSTAVSEVRRKCVPYYKPKMMRVEGEWGGWSQWSTCTVTCGLGRRLRHRFCDDPQPSNGGRYCQGDAIEEASCEAPACLTELSQYPAPASTPGGGVADHCICGCTLALEPGSSATITASAAECIGTAVWLLQAPPEEHVVAEVAWATLRPGAQWLKLRDGDSIAAPLLVRLPSAEPPDQAAPDHHAPAPSLRHLSRSPRRTSSGSMLLLEFRSDVNTSVFSGVLNPASWGFQVTAYPSAESVMVGEGEMRPDDGIHWGLLAGIHVAAVVFVAVLVAAVLALAVYHWWRYRLYKRARLIPDSPYSTPPSTPAKGPGARTSTLTLTEVISLKSLVLRPKVVVSRPLRRCGSSASYSALETEQPQMEPQHSLPNLLFLTRRVTTPVMLRRSSSQLGRLLRKGSGTFKRKKRRFSSMDELETRCISPIHETQPEDDGDPGKEVQVQARETEKNGEEASVKYREHRKSMLSQEATVRDPRLTPKLAKDRMNLERVRRSAISRSTSIATMRAASSVSEMSFNGTDTEMEYDYYDYDMDNALAVPGSFFGMDPLLLAWAPSFLSMPGDTTPVDEGIPLNVLNHTETTPAREEPVHPSDIPLSHLNIPLIQSSENQQSIQGSVKSDETNDQSEAQGDDSVVEISLVDPTTTEDDNDRTPTTHSSSSKILNLDDIQFADDSDDDGEDAL